VSFCGRQRKDKTMVTFIVCVTGLILGMAFSKWLGDSREANVLRVILVLALILFAMWNEGVLG